MTEFCVRLKKVESIPPKWFKDQVYMEAWSSKKLWESRTTVVKSGTADWGEMGEEFPVFLFTTEAGTKSKLTLTFKLKVAGKGKKIGVAKWPLEVFTFVSKTELVSTAIQKKDGAPRLVCNVIDKTALKRKGKIPSFLSFTENKDELQSVKRVKAERRLSARLSAKVLGTLKHSYPSGPSGESQIEMEDEEKVERKSERRSILGRKRTSSTSEKEDSASEKSKGGKKTKKSKEASRSRKNSESSSSNSDDQQEHESSSSTSGSAKKKGLLRKKDGESSKESSKKEVPKKKPPAKKSKNNSTEEDEQTEETEWDSLSTSKGGYKCEEESDTENEKSHKSTTSTSKVTITEKGLFSAGTVVKGKDSYDILYKVIILGDSGVGKTCLFERWTKDEVSTTTKATVTTGFANKSFKLTDGDVVRVQFWDTAGQERYKAMTRQYYNGANGAVLVYSISDSSSFSGVETWLKDIMASVSDEIPIIVIGNKSDLSSNMRQVKKSEAEKFADEHNLLFVEVSALNGDNTARAMQQILQTIHMKNLGEEQETKEKKGKKGVISLHGKSGSSEDSVEDSEEEDGNCCSM